MLGAALDGIEQGMNPGEPEMGNAYENETAGAIPADLGAAVELAKGSDWLKGVMGEMVFEFQIQQAERELEFFAQQVTPVETQRYLRTL